LAFNKGSEFFTAHEPDPEFIKTEPMGPNGEVFDIDPDEIASLWEKLDSYKMDL